jgi:hypothetical protein
MSNGYVRLTICVRLGVWQSWSSASRSMPPASAFRNPVSQSGTGLGALILATGLLRHRHFCSFWYRIDWMPDSPTFQHLKKGYTLHVHTTGGRRGYTLHVHTAYGNGQIDLRFCFRHSANFRTQFSCSFKLVNSTQYYVQSIV